MVKQFVVAVALLLSATNASPLLGSDDSLVGRQTTGSYYPITGATGGVYPRLEIRDLEKTGEMWNLFLLALADFQAMDQKVINSYYQIAGIHGMPWTPWDGVDVTPRPEIGYCPHNNLLFGTWHRPYLMLFEQNLQSIAKGIASKFPTTTRSKYQDAATKLRVPYWDSYKAVTTSTPVYPTAISNPTARVTFPNGTTASVSNPLYSYKFHPLDNKQINGTGCAGSDDTGPAVCQNSPATIRPATSTLNAAFRNILESQRGTLYTLLSTEQSINSIISTQGCGSQRYGSIEGTHGAVHTLHYPGHMAPAGATAFDPLFWLHHSNVDRQIAIWQALWPSYWINDCFAFTPTWTITVPEDLFANSSLTPFHKNTAGTFWNSNDVRNIRNLGYTYPELANNPSIATLTANINKQYGGPADVPVTASSSKTRALKGAEPLEKYFAQVNLPAYGLDDGKDGSLAYNILIFAGEVGNDASSWVTSSNMIGIASTLGGVGMKQDLTLTSLIDITPTLTKALEDGSTTSEKAVDYLKEKLSYRIEIGGKAISRDRLSKLEINLVSSAVKQATSEGEFSTLVGDFKEHGEIGQ